MDSNDLFDVFSAVPEEVPDVSDEEIDNDSAKVPKSNEKHTLTSDGET